MTRDEALSVLKLAASDEERAEAEAVLAAVRDEGLRVAAEAEAALAAVTPDEAERAEAEAELEAGAELRADDYDEHARQVRRAQAQRAATPRLPLPWDPAQIAAEMMAADPNVRMGEFGQAWTRNPPPAVEPYGPGDRDRPGPLRQAEIALERQRIAQGEFRPGGPQTRQFYEATGRPDLIGDDTPDHRRPLNPF